MTLETAVTKARADALAAGRGQQRITVVEVVEAGLRTLGIAHGLADLGEDFGSVAGMTWQPLGA